jgi:dihydroxyacid dehydratase/phosphogluconate dehydratase
MLMAAVRCNLPAIFVSGGPMEGHSAKMKIIGSEMMYNLPLFDTVN